MAMRILLRTTLKILHGIILTKQRVFLPDFAADLLIIVVSFTIVMRTEKYFTEQLKLMMV